MDLNDALLKHSLPDPPQESQQIWERHTNYEEPFTLSVRDAVTPITFPCPKCNLSIVHDPYTYATFRMRQGRLNCPSCLRSFSCDNVSARHFTADLGAFVQNRNKLLKGSALSIQTCAIDVSEARQNLELMFCPEIPNVWKVKPGISIAVNEIVRYGRTDPAPKWETLLKKYFREMLNPALQTSGRKIHGSCPSRLVMAYRNIPFKDVSLDLIAAVVRQRGFAAKMVSGVVDWSDRNTLTQTTVRYHKFLMIMQKHKDDMFVPTLDIDLAWHTFVYHPVLPGLLTRVFISFQRHQLHPGRYQNYGIQNVGRIINHDDSIEETSLAAGFDGTSTHWRKFFGEEYAQVPPKTSSRGISAISLRSLHFPPYAILSKAKSIADKRTHHGVKKKDESLGGCAFHESNAVVKKLREKGELGRYSQGATCTVCGISVLLSCADATGDWETKTTRTFGGEANGACAAAQAKESGFLYCGSKGGFGYAAPEFSQWKPNYDEVRRVRVVLGNMN